MTGDGDRKENAPTVPESAPESSWPLLTAVEIAEMLSVPRTWVWEAARTGRLPCYRLGKYVRFSLPEVLETVGRKR